MKKLSKLVLGLASIAMLTACEKDATKEEVQKVADGYDTSFAYTSGEEKISLSVETNGGDNPATVKTLILTGFELTGIRDGKVNALKGDAVNDYRFAASSVAILSEQGATFKLDGNKIIINQPVNLTFSDVSLKGNGVTRIDEHGFCASSSSDLTGKVGETSITVKLSQTYSWTK